MRRASWLSMLPVRSLLVSFALVLLVPALPARVAANDRVARGVSRALLNPWVKRYERTAKVARSRLESRRPDRYAMRVFLLERELVDMLQHVNQRADLSRAQRSSVSNDIRGWFGRLQHSYTTIQAEMRQRVEDQAPNTSGATLVDVAGKGRDRHDLYTPSYHSTKPLPKAEQMRRYRALRDKHAAAHPGQRPYVALNAKNLKDVRSGELLEWVSTRGGHLRVTRNAKHVVVGGGQPARSAGGLKIFWSQEGQRREPLLAVVTNWSGTYQPDMASVGHTMVSRLQKLGIPSDRIVYTASMPVSTKMFETLVETRHVEKAKAKAQGARLVRAADHRAKVLASGWSQAISQLTARR